MRLIVFCLALLISACNASPDYSESLNPEVRYTADTMFAHRKSLINASMDSLCEELNLNIYESIKDSMLNVELKRIEQLSQKK